MSCSFFDRSRREERIGRIGEEWSSSSLEEVNVGDGGHRIHGDRRHNEGQKPAKGIEVIEEEEKRKKLPISSFNVCETSIMSTNVEKKGMTGYIGLNWAVKSGRSQCRQTNLPTGRNCGLELTLTVIVASVET